MWSHLPTRARVRQDPFVTPDLAGFEKHLRRYGTTDLTIDAYVRQVRLAYDAGDPLLRLTGEGLAPKSRHLVKSALSSYARFARDEQLSLDLRSIRLPPSRRTQVKEPLSDAAWRALHREVELGHETDPAVAVVGVMERRGLRVGDVLRLRRAEVDRALETDVLAHEGKGRRRVEFGVLPTYRRFLETLAGAFDRGAAGGTRVWQTLTSGQRVKAAAWIVAARLDDLAEEAGIGHVHPHKLRRTYATWYYGRCGRDLEALRQHMQWASITTAQAYVDHDRRVELDALALALDDE